MKVPLTIKNQIIEIKKKDGSKSFLLQTDDKCVEITQEQYNILMRG